MNTQIMSIPLDRIDTDPVNVRRIPIDGAVEQMAQSMAAIGQLEPIIVRPHPDEPDRWYCLIGGTRLAAARSLGWDMIKAMQHEVPLGEDAEDCARAASAAENMVRRGIHPVDQWRAIVALADKGYSYDRAAAALGVDVQFARRLEKMGRLLPDLLDELGRQQVMPVPAHLAAIANAPHDVQQAALVAELKRSKGRHIDWWAIARDCTVTRISLKRAIFDAEGSGVVFDEDLFAEPGSDEQFTTTDVKGFIAAQKAALAARIAASKGRLIEGALAKDDYTLAVPPGYVMTHDTVLKKWRKDDPRRVLCAVSLHGYRPGELVERVIQPKAKAPTHHDTRDEPGAEAQERAPREPITKAVQARLAAIKREAVQAVLPSFVRDAPATDLLRVLLLTFAADNLAVRNGSQLYGGRSLADVVHGLISEDGEARMLSQDDLAAIVCEVIGRVVMFDHPNAVVSSGAAAEWIGRLVGAQDHLPRFDTEEILAGYSRDALVEIARAHGINDHGTGKDVRKRMIGNMPGWRPVEFAAAGPAFVDDDDVEETEEQVVQPAHDVPEDAEEMAEGDA